jgi:hypothetical protein
VIPAPGSCRSITAASVSSAATRSRSGLEISVGWYQRTPSCRSARPSATTAPASAPEQVDVGVAVDLGVDEPGDCKPAPAARETDLRDAAVRDRDVAGTRAPPTNAAATPIRRVVTAVGR